MDINRGPFTHSSVLQIVYTKLYVLITIFFSILNEIELSEHEDTLDCEAVTMEAVEAVAMTRAMRTQVIENFN